MPVQIARCPEHGLHGERQECFVCGGPVEQVQMYTGEEVADAFNSRASAYIDGYRASLNSVIAHGIKHTQETLALMESGEPPADRREQLESACKDLLAHRLSTTLGGGDPGMVFDSFDRDVERQRRGYVAFDLDAVERFVEAVR